MCARLLRRLHSSASAGPYVTSPQWHRQLVCIPHEQATMRTNVRSGRRGCPRGQRVGALLSNLLIAGMRTCCAPSRRSRAKAGRPTRSDRRTQPRDASAVARMVRAHQAVGEEYRPSAALSDFQSVVVNPPNTKPPRHSQPMAHRPATTEAQASNGRTNPRRGPRNWRPSLRSRSRMQLIGDRGNGPPHTTTPPGAGAVD